MLCRVQVPQEHFLGTLMSCTGLSMIISRDTLSGTGSSRTFLGYSYVVYRFVNDNIARYSVGYRFLKNISWVLLMSYTGLSMIISRDTLSGTGSSRTFLGYSYVVQVCQ